MSARAKPEKRASFATLIAVAALATALGGLLLPGEAQAQVYDSSGVKVELDPASIQKYEAPLIIPPAMPRSAILKQQGGKPIDFYRIAVRQFMQQILPPGMPMTTVWSYASMDHPETLNYPAFTIEADWRRPVRVEWVNDLVDAQGNALPHLLPVDPTLHWANPVGVCFDRMTATTYPGTDCKGEGPGAYTGPVPMIPHLHGAETTEWSDGYPEAWFLPAGVTGYETEGSLYALFKAQASDAGIEWAPGSATFEYPNDQRATTLWYHDHSLGMTRLNVYAGPAGFYLIRGGPDDAVMDMSTGMRALLPGPAPNLVDLKLPPNLGKKSFREIPIVIQDRSFFDDGSLAYPDNRAFFEGVNPYSVGEPYLDVPFIPDTALGGEVSDVSALWNPEFFGNTLVTNGRTWPLLEVEPRRYRFRLLNGCQSRFLILELSNGGSFWQIGADGGFLNAPEERTRILMGPAERADVIVDFAGLPKGTEVILRNLGPDEPFGGGEPWFGCEEAEPGTVPEPCFEPADPGTTGQVMKFRVIKMKSASDDSTPPQLLQLPVRQPLGVADTVRQISLNEMESEIVLTTTDATGNIVESPLGEPFGPQSALLGTLDATGNGVPLMWGAMITENPGVGDTETWEIYNFTMDAHPIHIHLVQFEILGREVMGDPAAVSAAGSNFPVAGEEGTKDTVIAYPGEITRVKARFNLAGLYVWHCHILEHEDNEMMRPYCVDDSAACQAHNAKAHDHPMASAASGAP